MRHKISEIDSTNFDEVEYSTLKRGADAIFNSSWKIDNKSYLNEDVIELLIEYHKQGQKVNQLFRENCGHIESSGYEYKMKPTCHVCGRSNIAILTKTKLLNYINNNGLYTCPDCNKRIDDAKKQKEAEERSRDIEIRIAQKEENTQKFIDDYLNPNNSWVSSIGIKERFNEITDSYVDWDKIANRIKSMEYREFLQTPYWKAVAGEVRRKHGFKCQLCNDNHNIAVHHRTYENHGYEHMYHVMRDDLIVLCDKCHKKFHDIVED